MSDSEQRPVVSPEEVERLFERLDREAESAGYHLNPNREFTLGLIEGMLVNERRYGYWACPCRLASGVKKADLDIICPCDYRDQDITEFGACYCGLYVNKPIFEGKQTLKPIPERRKPSNIAKTTTDKKEERDHMENENSKLKIENSGLPVWRCTVCGYLCAREDAPEICPICGVAHDRFERFE